MRNEKWKGFNHLLHITKISKDITQISKKSGKNSEILFYSDRQKLKVVNVDERQNLKGTW